MSAPPDRLTPQQIEEAKALYQKYRESVRAEARVEAEVAVHFSATTERLTTGEIETLGALAATVGRMVKAEDARAKRVAFRRRAEDASVLAILSSRTPAQREAFLSTLAELDQAQADDPARGWEDENGHENWDTRK